MYHLATCIAAAALGKQYLDIPWYIAVAVGTATYLLTGGWKFARIIHLTLGRDVRFMAKGVKIVLFVRKLLRENKISADVFAETAKKYPTKDALVCAETGEKLTYKDADELINKIANIFQEAGYQKGDVVGLLMENCIEYFPIWLGLSKIGVIISLLNFNLKQNILSEGTLSFAIHLTLHLKTNLLNCC